MQDVDYAGDGVSRTDGDCEPFPSDTPERVFGDSFEPQVSWRGSLSKIIEAEIIPRLMLSHQQGNSASANADTAVSAPDLADFTQCLLRPDDSSATSYVEMLQRKGFSPSKILLDVLAHSARELGALWESDDCDFVQVTVGLRRLHTLLQAVGQDHEAASIPSPGFRRAMFLPTPGESHCFGVAMVESFFRADGWEVVSVRSTDHASVLAGEWIDVLGFSLSCSKYIDDLRAVVEQARRVSMNPHVLVLVGGPELAKRPELAGLVGADGSAPDAAAAVLLAQTLLQQRAFV